MKQALSMVVRMVLMLQTVMLPLKPLIPHSAIVLALATHPATAEASTFTLDPNRVILVDPSTLTPSQNILLVIADDIGVESIDTYHDAMGIFTSGTAPSTPTINDLADAGVTFLNAWSNPTCTPTRAGIYSGLHSFTHGLTHPTRVEPGGSSSVSLEANLSTLGLDALPNILPSDYQSGLFGKWHQGGENYDAVAKGTCDYYDSPANLGWDAHRGGFGGGLSDYWSWQKTVDGACPTTETKYATVDAVTEASSWINSVKSDPWFATVAFNAPHTPLHNPYSYGSCGTTDRICFRAMVNTLDTQLGNLLDDLDDMGELAQTVVIFVGDNGTDQGSAEGADGGLETLDPYPAQHWKGSVYQGGVNVPLIIADGCVLKNGAGSNDCRFRPGATVLSNPGRTEDALTHSLDLFATVADLARVDSSDLADRDSISLRPYLTSASATHLRETVYTGGQDGSGCAIRGEEYKLVLETCEAANASSCELFDLSSDPFEEDNLLVGTYSEDEVASLATALQDLRGWSDSPCSDFVTE